MKCFLIANEEVVGWSEFPGIDRAMSIVSGVFHPNENYPAIQPLMLRYQHDMLHYQRERNPVELEQVRKDIAALEMRVQTEDGRWLEADNGVYLADFSEELGTSEEDTMELTVLGVVREMADELWPEAE